MNAADLRLKKDPLNPFQKQQTIQKHFKFLTSFNSIAFFPHSQLKIEILSLVERCSFQN